MKEKPILFSGEMVKAILEGRKTQTRRLVKLDKMHPDYGNPMLDKAFVDPSYLKPEYGNVPCLKIPYGGGAGGLTVQRYFPRWEPGDRLWVKETFYPMPHLNAKAYFRATDRLVGVSKWKPSIFMPRKLSRITLEITSMRVERLQDISDADVLAEGASLLDPKHEGGHEHTSRWWAYRNLWESINGKGSWDANPWVWVIEFKKL